MTMIGKSPRVLTLLLWLLILSVPTRASSATCTNYYGFSFNCGEPGDYYNLMTRYPIQFAAGAASIGKSSTEVPYGEIRTVLSNGLTNYEVGYYKYVPYGNGFGWVYFTFNIVEEPDLQISGLRVFQPAGTDARTDLSGNYILEPGVPAIVQIEINGSNIAGDDLRMTTLAISVGTANIGTTQVAVNETPKKIVKEFQFIPAFGKSAEIKAVIDPNGAFKEANFTNNTATVMALMEVVPLHIESVRVAQTVFEPSAYVNNEVDLVSKKGFVLEVTLRVDHAISNSSLKAKIEATLPGMPSVTSTEFSLGDITDQKRKLFLYFSGSSDGAKTIVVQIIPTIPVPGIFDSTTLQPAQKSVVFHSTSLKVLAGKIESCAQGYTCFPKVNAEAEAFFKTKQLPLAELLLPLAPGSLTLMPGASIVTSKPGATFSLARDILAAWQLKKDQQANLAAYQVNSNYFQFHNETDTATLGFGLPYLRTFIFTSISSDTFVHEAIHALGHIGHSTSDRVDGAIIDSTNGRVTIASADEPLTNDVPTRLPSFKNAMFGTTDGSNEMLGLDRVTYGSAMAGILDPLVDPPVVLVTGIVDANNKVVETTARKTNSVLDALPRTSNMQIRGLNSAGSVVSSVATVAISEAEVLTMTGAKSVSLNGYVFAATLPDTGSISSLQILKDNVVVLSRPLIDKPVCNDSLKSVISQLQIDHFRNARLAQNALKVVNATFKVYETALTKGKKIEASLALILLRLTLATSLKSEFKLGNGCNVKLADVLKLQ